MARNREPEKPPIEARHFKTPEEVDAAITKLKRRIEELDRLDVEDALSNHTGADDVATSNVRHSILDVFGPNSPEFREHEHVQLWSGGMYMGMSHREVVEGTRRGVTHVRGILQGLVGRLEERRSELGGPGAATPASYVRRLNLHPRIADVALDLFEDGYPWEAVFAASKALVNYVKERSGRHDLDGTNLVRTVFSKNAAILAFNALADQTDQDEQEGMMHLFEGAVMAIRNPGGHTFPEGPEQRAVEYLSLLSLLAYRVQEAQRKK